MTQAVHLDHHPFVFWNWTCLRLELISTSWGLTNHFWNIIFCATLQYHHGVAQQLQDLGGLSWFGPALAAVTSDVAGWSWWGERRVLIVEQRGFCLHLFASRLSRMLVSVFWFRNPGHQKVRSFFEVLRWLEPLLTETGWICNFNQCVSCLFTFYPRKTHNNFSLSAILLLEV